VVCYDADFYPYGGERPYINTCSPIYKFEGKERDTETANDDFGARYYSNRFGRWLSADWSAVPVAVPYANLANPQTLNLYSMVADDPESFADLDGHLQNSPANAPCSYENKQQCNNSQQQQSQAADVALGVLKEVGNTLASVAPGSALLGEPFSASNDTQDKAMTITAIGVLLIPGGGEEEAGAKVEAKLAQKAEQGIVKAAEEILSRLGTSKESAGRLGRKAAEAEEKIGIHGVSVTGGTPSGPGSSAGRSTVEGQFPVHNTPTNADPLHRTVELPKPVTQKAAEIFNALFGRK
jgi:RHS repeat-associated protein